MTFLIYGECNERGSGAWCYYESLKDMGHDVYYYTQQENLERYSSSLIFRIIRRVNGRMPLSWHRRKHVRGFINTARNVAPHIVIVLKGLLIDRAAIENIKQLGPWTALINHDDFFSSFRGSRSRIQFNAIPAYDYVFCTKEINVAEVLPYNGNTEMMSFAFYPKVHKPPKWNLEDREKWSTDVVFVGSYYPERFRQIEFLLINFGAAINLKIYGSNWNKSPRNSPVSGYIQNAKLSPEDMSKAVYYSKVSLGFLCKENRDDYTQRSFEIPASKGVLLAERTSRHLSYYRENEEAVFFDTDNYSELVSKVQQLLCDPETRERIRQGGYDAVISAHQTYVDRMIQLLSAYYRTKDAETKR